MFKKFIISTSLLILASCATDPSKIGSSYVDPFKYKDHDCNQLNIVRQDLEQNIKNKYLSLKKTANGDKIQATIGAVLFWPALLALDGSKEGEDVTEFKQLKGELKAVKDISIRKKCNIDESSSSKEESKDSKEKK